MDLAVYSFFSGSGLLDLGFEDAGYRIEFVNEYSESFLRAYRYARQEMKHPEPTFGHYCCDINQFLDPNHQNLLKLVEKSRENADLVGFIGGPPCPDFSVAGKNKGRDGINGKLSQSYVDLICNLRPDFFLFENVKGLWSTSRHREYYNTLKNQLQQNGYIMTDRLVNSIEFGAPQDRNRVMLFGLSSNILHNATELKQTEMLNWSSHCDYNRDILKAAPWPDCEPFVEGSKRDAPSNIPLNLTVQHWFETNKVIDHPNSEDFFQPRQGLQRMMTISEGDTSRKCYKRLHRWRYSPTAAYGNNEVHLHPYETRRISVAEALAIQSMPSDFCLPPDMTLTDKFKTVGNGVPYLMSKGVAMTIRDFLGGDSIEYNR